jgi:DNA-binding GntR family transcriptional regulator
MINKETYLPLREEAYQLIKKMILKGEFKPGERLSENQLGKRLGVSRTPIRESFRRLAAEELVYISPKGGARISELTREDIDEIYEIRDILESFAAQKAALLITDAEIQSLKRLIRESKKCFISKDVSKMAGINTKFHNVLCKASKNRRLFKLIDILYAPITQYIELILETGGMRSSIEQHEEILDAVIKRDGRAAKESTHNHIVRGREIILKKAEKDLAEASRWKFGVVKGRNNRRNYFGNK